MTTPERHPSASWPEQAQHLDREQKKRNLQQELNQLKSQITTQKSSDRLKSNLEAQKSAEKKEKSDLNALVDWRIVSLEKAVDQLNSRNHEQFDLQVAKIEQQIDAIRQTRGVLDQFKRQVVSSLDPKQLQQVQRKLVGHSQRSIENRVKSINKILAIDPAREVNRLAQWAARWIQRLVA